MSNLSNVTLVTIPQRVIDGGRDILRAAGRAHLEGMVLWAGRQDGQTFHVTDLIVPRQKGLRTKDGVCVVVDGDELHRLNIHLFETDLRLIAQIHSHPTEAYHSETDDRYAVATTIGSFSLVVPDFAIRPFTLTECAIYRLKASGEWSPVDETQLPNKLMIKGD